MHWLYSIFFLQVALASGLGSFTGEVRQAQLKAEITNLIVVDAKGLQLQNDKVHLTTSAQVVLGEKLATAFH